MLSGRSNWSAAVNRLTLAKEERRRSGGEIIDLTVSNPTHAAIDYPLDELSDAMSRGSRAPYDPQPLGIPSARAAVAAQIGCDPADVIITASTSEAYSFLFKLLCDPGDAVLTATPSYPLIEQLAALELIEMRSFALELHARWELDAAEARAALTPKTKAVVVINPNNPTGSYIRLDEQEALAGLGLPIISDEVLFDYHFAGERRTFVRDDVLTFTLGGLSKSAGLPHFKLGWIRIGGPEVQRRRAIDALEVIADNFLSVSTPVQEALPDLLRIGASVRERIRTRTGENLAHLRGAMPRSVSVLPVEGGWTAVLRVPRISSDDDLAIALLERGVLVQPGYFFDFERDGYIVVSLLTPPEAFVDGLRRISEAMMR